MTYTYFRKEIFIFGGIKSEKPIRSKILFTLKDLCYEENYMVYELLALDACSIASKSGSCICGD
jgi:hypothetical protein